MKLWNRNKKEMEKEDPLDKIIPNDGRPYTRYCYDLVLQKAFVRKLSESFGKETVLSAVNEAYEDGTYQEAIDKKDGNIYTNKVLDVLKGKGCDISAFLATEVKENVPEN